MLSVSKLLEPRLAGAGPLSRYSGKAVRPVVVWNMTGRCELRCVHCYYGSGVRNAGELTTAEGRRLVEDLASFGVQALIFSGGEPLEREDFFQLAGYAGKTGLRTVLSTNGVNIDRDIAKRIKDAGVSYAGVSIDGGEETNDRLRGVKGAYKRAVEGIRFLKGLGMTVGVRFTLSKKTVKELPAVFRLMEDEGIDRGYFAHLVYSGRGLGFSREDLSAPETRAALDCIFDMAEGFIKRGVKKDIVTGSNDADGAYLYLRLRKKDPAKAEKIYRLLLERGGNSSGGLLAAVDSTGDVHPDQFWRVNPLGNVREKSFSAIWTGGGPLLEALRDRAGRLKGRCAGCGFLEICNGGYRVRALAATGDIWAADPACYLTDEEISFTMNLP
ncbi:MAG: radical SAM protein [Deltaproteobacteria bacterium]|nr:radical SAM protein [Deltaproteobacteria bacterium]